MNKAPKLAKKHYNKFGLTLYSFSFRMGGHPLFLRWFSSGFVIFLSGTTW